LVSDMDRSSVESELQRIVADCYAEFPRDWVGLWEISDSLVAAYPTATWLEVRTLALEVVQRLLADPRVHAGRLSAATASGFDPWPLTTEESMQRIVTEWEVLGRNPHIDEICWFDLD